MSAPAALFAREIEAEYPAPDESCTKALFADAALRVIDKGTNGRSPLARHDVQGLSENPVVVRPSVQSFHGYREVRTLNHRPHPFDRNSVERTTQVSLAISSETISERASKALKRRLRPNTTLSAYELSRALRISEPTVWNILSGNSKSGPSGRVLEKLVEFFGASFLQEVFGGPNIHVIDPREAHKASALRKLAEAHEELRRMA